MDSGPVSEVDNASRVVHCVAINNARGIGAWEELMGTSSFLAGSTFGSDCGGAPAWSYSYPFTLVRM